MFPPPLYGRDCDDTTSQFETWHGSESAERLVFVSRLAPYADTVAVAGTFNDWSPTAHPLALEDHGYWSLEVAAAQDGDEYKYVIRHGNEVLWKNDPYARETTNSNGNSVIADPRFDWGDEHEYHTPAWHEMVIYELHIGTFNDQPGGPVGNFESAIQKLDYLADIVSVNAVLLMPPYDYPGASSWGYNPAHIFAIERDYGGPQALRKFVRAAHERGIAVIFDVVYNHFGPDDLSLWRFDGWSRRATQAASTSTTINAATHPGGLVRTTAGARFARIHPRQCALLAS